MVAQQRRVLQLVARQILGQSAHRGVFRPRRRHKCRRRRRAPRCARRRRAPDKRRASRPSPPLRQKPAAGPSRTRSGAGARPSNAWPRSATWLDVAVLHPGQQLELRRHLRVALPRHARRQGAIARRSLPFQGLGHGQEFVDRTHPCSRCASHAHCSSLRDHMPPACQRRRLNIDQGDRIRSRSAGHQLTNSQLRIMSEWCRNVKVTCKCQAL